MNSPPTIIFPSGCTAIAWTGRLRRDRTSASTEPSALSAADAAPRRRARAAAAEHREVAADQDLAVRLHDHGSDDAVRAWIERRIDRLRARDRADGEHGAHGRRDADGRRAT